MPSSRRSSKTVVCVKILSFTMFGWFIGKSFTASNCHVILGSCLIKFLRKWQSRAHLFAKYKDRADCILLARAE